jgi:AraC-like DNA-binding protein
MSDQIINEIVEYNNEIPCQILTFYYDGGPFFPGTKKHLVPLHWHTDVEINYNFDNETTAQIDVDGRTIESQNDAFIIINSCSIHGNTLSKSNFIKGEPALIGICLRISDSVFRRMMPNFDILQFNSIWHPSTTRPKEIMLELSKYGYPDSKFEKYDNIKINALIYELIFHLCRENLALKDSQLSASDLKNLEKIRKIMAFIETNYRNPIDEVSLALKFGYTPTYFSKMFKKYSDMSYKEFITKTRLSAAKQLLLSTDSTILDIAMDCGFSDVRGLIQAFKKYENTTPTIYRRESLL